MSTSLSHPTRQQLDELDALLQRMLALPVNQAEDVIAEINATAKTTATLRQEPMSYRTAEYGDDNSASVETEAVDAKPKTPPRLDEAHVSSSSETKEDADTWVPLSSTWKPSPHTWKPLAQSWQQPRTKPAQEVPPSREEPVEALAPKPPAVVAAAKMEPLAPIVSKAPAPVPAMPVPQEPPPPGWMRLLWWCNVAFDLLLLPWGPPGRWLRRDGGGRSVLGIAGVVLFVAALGLTVLEWFGWTWEVLFDKIR
jgi:hypothetical protein